MTLGGVEGVKQGELGLYLIRDRLQVNGSRGAEGSEGSEGSKGSEGSEGSGGCSVRLRVG